MSFKFKLVEDIEVGFHTVQTEVFCDTTNPGLVALWQEAGVYECLYDSDGKSAREISRCLAYGLDRITADESLSRVIPVSVAGGQGEAVRFIENVLRGCAVHPDARVETS